jgi:hypothetical protein
MSKTNVLTVRTATQAALFECELKGQLSDGAWENTAPHDHWECWSDATVVVGSNVGRNFWARKSNYNFARKDLLEVVSERMIGYARIAKNLSLPVAKALTHAVSDDFTIDWSASWNKDREAAVVALGYTAGSVDRALGDSTYGMKELRADLRELNAAVKIETR